MKLSKDICNYINNVLGYLTTENVFQRIEKHHKRIKGVQKMKDVTYEDWLKNPTPRKMWVWDRNESMKKQYKVVYFLKKQSVFPILAVTDDEKIEIAFKHCAEIEKQRRMTNKELSRWLREKPTREFKFNDTRKGVFDRYTYYETNADDELGPSLLIREDDGEWREPLVETEE